jgi:hypothetical protein
MKTEDWIKLLGVAVIIGFVLATIFFALGGKIKEIEVGPVIVEMPGNTPATSSTTSTPYVEATSQVATQQNPPVVDETATARSIKCDAIRSTLPQTLEEVRVKFGLPANNRNFRLIYEECGATATGFIFEGDTEFELSVPEGGCIDSYSGAYFSEQPVSHSFGGLRVYSGIVRTTGMTYRVAWCELKQ